MTVGNHPERVFLFLQGPLSTYYSEVAAELQATGSRVHKIHLCGNDIADWSHGDPIHYSGGLEDWPEFLADTAHGLGITDIVLHGDRRPYHIPAIEWALANSVQVHVTELGYLRPDWMTIEPFGVSVRSRFPTKSAAIQKLAGHGTAYKEQTLYRDEAMLMILQEFRWTLFNLIYRFRFPNFVSHRTQSPWVVYPGWVLSRLRNLFRGNGQPSRFPEPPYYVMALQLEGDLQLVENSPFSGMAEAIEEVMASFANHAPENASLVFKLHPHEYRRRERHRDVKRIACAYGLQDRVRLVENTPITELCKNAQGFVTVNSSAGLEALAAGTPVHTITRTIYSVEGLVFDGGLDEFWTCGKMPDPLLLDRLKQALAAKIQVRGTLYNRDGRKNAARETAAKIIEQYSWLDELK